MVRAHGDDYRRARHPSVAQEKVLRHIAACRTAALGGHLDACDACGHVRVSYNSCRDRHCPKCQGTQQADWLAQRLDRLLPVPYFHVVFTLPHALNPLFLHDEERLVPLLFQAAARTLQQVAADPRHLGAHIGFTAILHTWGRNLLLHPHLHVVVTGGGLSADDRRWVSGRERFFLPVRVLGRLFRGKFLAGLHRLRQRGQLPLSGSTAVLADPVAWSAFKDRLYRQDWVVYAKPPFGGPEQVFRYLGRYTHRVALSNHRIVDVRDGQVTFTVKDYADGGRHKLLTLDAVEFLRRFLLHVLPKRLVRIRHYGLYAGRHVHGKLSAVRALLGVHPIASPGPAPAAPVPEPRSWWDRLLAATGFDLMACPACETGRLVRQHVLTAAAAVAWRAQACRAPPAVPA